MFQPQGVNALLKDGGKHFAGVDEALLKNIEAVKELAKIVETSFGPNGQNKLVINHLGKQFVTSDTATMLKELEVQHPCGIYSFSKTTGDSSEPPFSLRCPQVMGSAHVDFREVLGRAKQLVTKESFPQVFGKKVILGRLLVQAATAQEFECGDSTNLTVMLAGALLAEAEALLKEGCFFWRVFGIFKFTGLHAADIIKGYEISIQRVLEILDKTECWRLEDHRNEAQIQKAIKTAICAKQMGLEEDISKLVAKAVCQITTCSKKREFELDNIRVTKIPGGSLSKSFVVDGMVVARPTFGTETQKSKAKVAVYAEGLEPPSTEAKGTVLLENAEQLLNFSRGEERQMEDFILDIKKNGVEVVIAGGAISDLAKHFLDKHKILAVRITSKFELRRMCRSLKAIAIIRQGAPLAEELGFVDEVYVEEIAQQKLTIFKAEESKVSTIVLRGAAASTLDEWERAVNDAANVIRVACQSPGFCAGGSATEMYLAYKLEEFGATVPGLDQYSVLKFAEALECCTKVLSDNAGYSRTDMLTSIYAKMAAGETDCGIKLDSEETSVESRLQNCKEGGILDHLDTKRFALKHAVEVVLTILRVDHIIMAKQAGQGAPRA